MFPSSTLPQPAPQNHTCRWTEHPSANCSSHQRGLVSHSDGAKPSQSQFNKSMSLTYSRHWQNITVSKMPSHSIFTRGTLGFSSGRQKIWAVVKKNQENRVWHDPLHKKMGNLIAILEHIQNRDLAHAPFSNTCELCHRLRWDGIQSNACTTRSKGLLVGIQDFDCHCSESKTVLMCNLLMHVQLYNGIFNIYTVMNAPADLRCRTT